MLKMECEMWNVDSGKGKAEFGMRNAESSGKWKVESNKEVESGMWNVESGKGKVDFGKRNVESKWKVERGKWKVEC